MAKSWVKSYFQNKLKEYAGNGALFRLKALLSFVNTTDSHQMSAEILLEAVHSNQYDVVEYLLERDEFKAVLSSKTDPGYAVRFITKAAHKNSVQMVEVLLAAGINPNVAFTTRHVEKECPPPAADYREDRQLRKMRGNTPLHFTRKKTVAGLLIEDGAVVDAPNQHGNTPLHIAVRKGEEKLVCFLVEEANAEINARNNWAQTPLHHAALYSNDSMIEILIKAPGIDLNAQDALGNTALHAVMYSVGDQSSRLKSVAHLLNAGANPAIQNLQGQTARELAELAQWKDIVALLPAPEPRSVSEEQINANAAESFERHHLDEEELLPTTPEMAVNDQAVVAEEPEPELEQTLTSTKSELELTPLESKPTPVPEPELELMPEPEPELELKSEPALEPAPEPVLLRRSARIREQRERREAAEAAALRQQQVVVPSRRYTR